MQQKREGDTTPMGHNQTICSHNFYVYLGIGDGTFQPPATGGAGFAEFSTVDAGSDLVAGDFNGDGKPDVVLAAASSVTVFLGVGDGTFQRQPSLNTNLFAEFVETPGAIATGDFNGDGIPDLAVANSDFTFLILTGNGDGTFRLPAGVTYTGSRDALAVADFNGDGRPDAMLASATGNSVSVLLGAATGAGYQLTATGGTPQSVNAGAAFAVPLAVTLLNNGAPVSGVTVTFAAPANPLLPTAILSGTTAVTNASGMASVTAVANEYTGGYAVSAIAQGLVVPFSLTNTGNQIVSVTAVSGALQSTAAGTAFPNPLKVTVKDYLGNLVSGSW